MGEADLEQVGAGLCDLVELTALGAGRMQSGGDEHAERAAGLGEEVLEGVGGGQEMSFSGGLVAEGGGHAVEGLGDLQGLVVSRVELLGDLSGDAVPLGSVLIALDDLGGVAQLLGDLPQDGGLLFRGGRGVCGLQKRVQGDGQRIVGRRKAVEGGVQCLGVDRHGSAPTAAAVLDGGLPAGAEADDHVPGSGTGVELVGEGTGEIMHGGGVGRGSSSDSGWIL